jgi:uncharacterized protein
MWGRAVAAVLVLAACAACGGSGDHASRVTVDIRQGSRTVSFRAEVAATEAERERGLMGRVSLGDSAGMLFLFPRPVHTGFWMKNTLIPLDIAFIDDDTVVEIRSMVPCRTASCPLTTPASFYDAALEVNPGSFAGLGDGARIVVKGPLPKVS